MLDANDLLIIIKKAAIEAVEAGKPTNLLFGKVTSSSPLKINVEQKMTLEKEQLILCRNVSDYKTKVSVNWQYETGEKEITVKNKLKSGDEVLILRMQGGQKYLVIDRVVNL